MNPTVEAAGAAPLRYTYHTKPRRYQEQALMKTYQLGGNIGLFMPMRTGKTKVAIDWAGISYWNFGVRRVLVVCPKTVMDEWRKQIERHVAAPWRIVLLDGNTNQNVQEVVDLINEESPPDALTWVIVNYEMVWRMLIPIKKDDSNAERERKRKRTLDRLIAAWKPDFAVADECHRLKWPNTEQSLALSRLGQVARMRMGLSGTPITKWVMDAFGQFRFINSNVFGIGRSAWKDFRSRYGVWGNAAYAAHAEVLIRLQNQEELISKIHGNSFRIRLKDAISELPERITQNVKVEMSPTAQRMYREMARDMITEIDGKAVTAKIVLEKSLRLSTLTSGWVKDIDGVIHDIDDAKLRVCIERVQAMIDQDEKVIVLCHYVHDYERVFEALQKDKIKAVLHAGTGKQKIAAREQFQQDPDTKVFVSQTATASLGLDLSVARMMIFYSWDHRWDTYTQAFERTFMPGNLHALGVYHLTVPNSIDMLKLRVIKGKGDLAEAVLFNPQSLFEADADEDVAA